MDVLWLSGDHSIVIATMPEECNVLIAVLEAIGKREGWEPADQLKRFRQSAVHFIALSKGVVAGGAQLVLPSRTGSLPCARVWPGAVIEESCAAHVTVLALHVLYRGAGLFWQLCTELWRYCVDSGIERLWFEVTPRTLQIYRHMGWPLTIRGELRPHWGEMCYLCSLEVEDLTREFLRRAERSETYRTIVLQGTRGGICLPADPLPRCS